MNIKRKPKTERPIIEMPATTKRTPPPPPPRTIKSERPTLDMPDSANGQKLAAEARVRRIAVIAVGEYAHMSMRRPRASINAVNHSYQRMMHLVSDEVMRAIQASTDSKVICDDIAMLVAQAAQEAFKMGVQHGAAS